MTLKTSTGSRYARILGIGGYRGSRVVDNAEMCTIIDSTPEWIEQRTGILERRWATEEETPLFMAVAAARKAIDRAGLDPSQIDAVICSTVSHFQQSPSLASYVSHELGLSAGPAAFDISAACAGYCYGIAMADSLVRTGGATNVLVIGVETLSRMVNFEDRSTAFLFSDGAGATVVGPSDEPALGPVVWGSDGSQALTIQIEDWAKVEDPEQKLPHISMDGRAVFRWATTAIAQKSREALDAAGISPEQLDVFIPHQANNRITDSMLRHLKLPDNVVVSRDIKNMGNSSAASVPLAMEALLESGEATSGQTALIIGFGAGLVYAGQVVILP
ncbi:MAG: beta-ketoacyl-ACP synthase III [Propionibacteriaceae bacterium]|nr:beta-ketoacyl-ACP synthase III [Propionibacteriaceae bacterium]